MMYKNNKKAIMFFPLMGVFTIILMALLFLEVSNSEDNIFDPNSQLLISSDLSLAFENGENVFMDTYVENFIIDSSSKFFNSYVSSNSKSFDFSKELYIGCSSSDNKIIFYNEKNIDDDVVNDFVDFDEQGEPINPIPVNCFTSDETFQNEFNSYVEDELQDTLDIIYDGNSYVSLESIDVSNLNGLTSVNVKTEFRGDSVEGVLVNDNSYSFQVETGDYLKLLEVLEKTFPLLSSRIGQDIETCKNSFDSGDKNILCIEKFFEEIVRDLDSTLLEIYDFKITKDPNEELESTGYYSLNFEVSKSSQVVLDFKVVLKNNIPLGLVEFDLNQYTKADDVVLVSIEKPSVNVEPYSFVIFFSYEDFLNKNEYSKYDEFFNLLETSQLPLKFKDSGINSGGGTYYRSTKESGLDMNFFLVGANEFKEDGKKDVKIHQAYDFQNEEYSLLDNRKLNFAVFAVDSNFIYFVDEDNLEKSYKSFVPEKVFGPNPLKESQVEIKNDLEGYEESFEFTIKDYDDSSVANFQINLGETFVKTISAPSSYPAKYLVTSDLDSSTQGYNEVVYVDSFILESNKEYDISIIPVDSSGKKIEYRISKENYIQTGPENNKYFIKENSEVDFKPYTNTVNIIDKKAPQLSDLNLNTLQIIDVGGVYNLFWEPNTNSDLDRIRVRGNAFIDSQNFDVVNSLLTKDNNILNLPSTSYSSIRLTLIDLYDSSNNVLGSQDINEVWP